MGWPRRNSATGTRRALALLSALALSAGLADSAGADAPEALRAGARGSPGSGETSGVDRGAWDWPLASLRIVEPYRQPAHRYAPGHRGIDLRARGDLEVRAPAAGVVAFTGVVAGRPIVTIDHGRGVVSTLEPVTGTHGAGERVDQGEIVGVLGAGGHVDAGELHLGARLDGEYINPLALLGGIPRAVLLPCC